MKHLKKFFAIILALALMLCVIAGCGSADDTSEDAAVEEEAEDTADSAGEAGETDEEEKEEVDGTSGENEDTAETSGENGEIVIGLLAPLTGELALYGQAVRNGMDLYVEQINADGGINGKTVVVKYYDEEGDTVKAVTGYNSLIDQGVVAILGDVTTAPSVAVVAESQEDNTPMITPTATAIAVTYDEETDTVYSNMFRACFIDPFQGETMANFAYDVLGAKTAAVLYDNGDTYSTGVYEYFVAQCEELGIEVMAVESYASGAVDFSGQLTNIAAADPDVLFLPIYYNDLAIIANQAAEVGLDTCMLGVDGWASILDAVNDASLLDNSFYCSGYSPEDPSDLVQTFLADYAEKYEGEIPNMIAAQGYDAAWILCDAIAVAEESGAEYGTDEYGQAIIDAMAATDSDFVTGHVTYDDHNDPQKTAAIIGIQDGVESFWGSY